MKDNKKNKAAVALAKLRHEKNPSTVEFYTRISKLGVAAKKAKKAKKETLDK